MPQQKKVENHCIKDSVVLCNNVQRLLYQMGKEYIPTEYRLLIYPYKGSLIAVLLHKGSELASIKVVHFMHMKETY